MAGNDWNSFMQGRTARIVLNGLCTVMCGSYAIDGVRELVSGGSELLVAQLGSTPYYALTIARIAVCAWVAVVFGRMVAKDIVSHDDE